MAEVRSTLSPSGRWELRHTNDYVVNAAGYGNGGWRYELIDRATGAVLRAWSGFATLSPWDASEAGTRSVAWEGERLRVTDADGSEALVDPG